MLPQATTHLGIIGQRLRLGLGTIRVVATTDSLELLADGAVDRRLCAVPFALGEDVEQRQDQDDAQVHGPAQRPKHVVAEARTNHAWMQRVGEHSLVAATTRELVGEHDVGELALLVRQRRRVLASDPIEVVKVQRAALLRQRRHDHDSHRSCERRRRLQRCQELVGQIEVAQVVDAELPTHTHSERARVCVRVDLLAVAAIATVPDTRGRPRCATRDTP